MKTYKATKENPIFKAGHKFEVYMHQGPTFMPGHAIDTAVLEEWIKKGYIKEVQKKEFTEDDMIDFLWNNSNKHKDHSERLLNYWKKQRSKF